MILSSGAVAVSLLTSSATRVAAIIEARFGAASAEYSAAEDILTLTHQVDSGSPLTPSQKSDAQVNAMALLLLIGEGYSVISPEFSQAKALLIALGGNAGMVPSVSAAWPTYKNLNSVMLPAAIAVGGKALVMMNALRSHFGLSSQEYIDALPAQTNFDQVMNGKLHVFDGAALVKGLPPALRAVALLGGVYGTGSLIFRLAVSVITVLGGSPSSLPKDLTPYTSYNAVKNLVTPNMVPAWKGVLYSYPEGDHGVLNLSNDYGASFTINAADTSHPFAYRLGKHWDDGGTNYYQEFIFQDLINGHLYSLTHAWSTADTGGWFSSVLTGFADVGISVLLAGPAGFIEGPILGALGTSPTKAAEISAITGAAELAAAGGVLAVSGTAAGTAVTGTALKLGGTVLSTATAALTKKVLASGPTAKTPAATATAVKVAPAAATNPLLIAGAALLALVVLGGKR